jgi:hypothetical protein
MARRKLANTDSRSFWYQGNKLHLRRAKANPAFNERVDERVGLGDYIHIATTGDVEVYEIPARSALHKAELGLGVLTNKAVEQTIVQAACALDWKLYRDAAQEFAKRQRYTGSGEELHQATAMFIFQREMKHIEARILARGGPSPVEIQMRLRELQAQKRGRVIVPARKLAVAVRNGNGL